jgi:ABC-2 type transport system ATP-binding protein
MIEVAGLSKTFGSHVAVDNLSLNVRAGEVFAFLGPNGAGKTTTIKMLTTLLKPSQGSIRIDGVDLLARPTDARKTFGIVFQESSLDQELTLYENLDLHGMLYGIRRRERVSRVKRLLTAFDLWDRRGDRAKKLSGGLKRRLEIARGLVHTPRILFLDEPTVGLDAQSRHLLWTQVGSMNSAEGVTVFLTTHYLDEAEKVAQRVGIIDHGRMISLGSPAELRTQTNASSLEDAYLTITGLAVRPQSLPERNRLRNVVQFWRRK